MMELQLAPHDNDYQAALAKLAAEDIPARIWRRDHTVWRPNPEEIANRLGWLDVAERLQGELPALQAFAAEVRTAGFTHALLLGMGGSSLAPEVLRKSFGVLPGGLDLAVLDSTDPGAVLGFAEKLDPRRTLFLVSTKSGGTVETFSFFKYFYNWATAALGAEEVGAHFAAITDPGSGLEETARRFRFRKIFLNDPEIGGRYSALSLFGLVPAALLGIDLATLTARAMRSAAESHTVHSPAVRLGAAMGALARRGRDKLTLLLDPRIASFGDWVEQLVAESTGKEGRGILPVVGEPVWPSDRYHSDRLFVQIGVEDAPDAAPQPPAGHPAIRLVMNDLYDLGAQFFLWEMATAVAGCIMEIQPFDQPNVEAAKVLARRMAAAYHETGALPAGKAEPPTRAGLNAFLSGVRPGDYVAVQAYLAPSPAMDAALGALREHIRSRTSAAVTIGYGPRFLHSTGQLHKGDGGRGLFLQLTSESARDAAIPDEAGSPASHMSFQILKMSQALGDYQALEEARPPRRVLRFHFEAGDAERVAALAG